MMSVIDKVSEKLEGTAEAASIYCQPSKKQLSFKTGQKCKLCSWQHLSPEEVPKISCVRSPHQDVWISLYCPSGEKQTTYSEQFKTQHNKSHTINTN